LAIQSDLSVAQQQLLDAEQTLPQNVQKVLALLVAHGCIGTREPSEEVEEEEKEEEKQQSVYELTNKGRIATHIRETHCLVFAELIQTKMLHRLNPMELVGILSCFTKVSVPEDNCTHFFRSKNVLVEETWDAISRMYQQFDLEEMNHGIDTGTNYDIQHELIEYAMEWCMCATDVECKLLLQQMSSEKDIFLGEFVKAILKINNVASELEKIAELEGDMGFLAMLKQIPQLTLKYVATNQSLYV
jgi:superfamily II RNA helicase